MSEIVQKIPARLESAVKGGYVTGAKDIVDDALGKAQSVVNEEHEEAISDLQENVGTGGSVDERIAAEKNRAIAAETALANGIAGLTQSEVVVGALPASGEANKVYRVPGETSYTDYAWNGSQFVPLAEYDNGIDDEPTAGSDNLVRSRGVAIHGGAFDVSEYNKNGNTLATYATLANALVSIPSSVRRGGMSIKFVQTSDNKYVQFRCTTDEFTTDVTKWSVCNSGVLIENPEFVFVFADKDEKILFGAYAENGDLYFGNGCPQQVKDFVLAHKAELISILNSKVDKVQGKGLIQIEVANNVSFIENPEWMCIKTDPNERILSGRDNDGRLKEFVGIDTLDIKTKKLKFSSEQEKEDFVEYLNVQPNQGLSTIVVDLPVSDGTDIQSGYAYIDSSTRNVKVKA